MNKLLLATAAIVVAFSALPFAARAAKPAGQAPPSVCKAQDTATMKRQIEIRPAAESRMKVIGTAHATTRQQRQL
jgi:hypothetical protein